MYLQSIFKTLISKSGILLLNFFTVVLTTNLWGTEGRGLISLVTANMAIIVIFNNIMAGSPITYLVSKTGLGRLLIPAYLWVLTVSLAGTFFFALAEDYSNPYVLFSITFFISLLNLNLMVFVGQQDLKWYNLYSFLSPALLVLFICVLEYGLEWRSVYSFFIAYIASQLLVYLLSLIQLRPYLQLKKPYFSSEVLFMALNYGWKNEFSYLLHFFNYRMAYFFILYYQGVSSVGLFSVGIAIAESTWLISKSISLVQYAKIINLDDREAGIFITKASARLSLLASLLIVGGILLIPAEVYGLVFGKEFGEIKQVLLLLAPGIVAMALSNIYGHYFAAINKQRLLMIRSALGLCITFFLSLLFIPLLGMAGACWATSVSYMASSVYVLLQFYKGEKIRLSDFLFTKADYDLLGGGKSGKGA